MTKLIIVESPTKAKTISRFLGRDFKVESSFGHIRDLPKNELGVDVEKNFEPKYIIPLKARKNVSFLKKAAKNAQTIILATDEDREGEAIAWHIAQILNLGEIKNQKSKIKNIERIVFHEITQKAVEEALKNPRDIDINLVDAQQARRILDRLVGYELSPFLWKKVARGLSAGRVQSVAVRLICEREEEIKNFIPQEYWTIEAILKTLDVQHGTSNVPKIEAVLYKINGETIPKPGIKTKSEANKILENLKGAEYLVKNVEKKEIARHPLPPFTTSTLQQAAWNRLHFSAKQTMRVAQQLYEGVELGSEGAVGLITYMRTDSLNLSRESVIETQKFLKENLGPAYALAEPRFFKTKTKGAQEAHEAIRPTEPSRTPDSVKEFLEPRQYKLYDLIWRRFIASQMPEAVFDATSVEIEAAPKKIRRISTGQGNYAFQANGLVRKFDGFLKIWLQKTEETILPDLTPGEKLRLLELKPEQRFTEPPARYSEATLVKTLEKMGIGRPSTYAPIISVIQDRRYAEKDENKKFRPTDIGILVNAVLRDHFPQIVDYRFTAKMEEELDEIAEGKIDWQTVIGKFYGPFKKNLLQKGKEVSKKELTEEMSSEICEKCGKPMIVKFGRYGKFLACTGFPECKNTKPLEKPVSTDVKCPKCLASPDPAKRDKPGEIVIKKTKRGKFFYGCSRWPECDFALWDKPTGKTCPKCGSLLVEKGKRIKCSNKECDYIDIPKNLS